MTNFSVVLSRRVAHQPKPHIHPGGDCGGCVLAGMLGLAVPEAYQRLAPRHVGDWYAMRQALWDALATGLLDRIVVDIPLWPASSFEVALAFGYPGTMQAQAWWRYLVMALDAGYYAAALVDHSREGGETDHWVLLCGARSSCPPEGGRVSQQVLVSCSSDSTPDEEWVDLHDFLSKRGGFNLLLARPVAP